MNSVGIASARKSAWQFISCQQKLSAETVAASLDAHVAEGVEWQVSHPINALVGRRQVMEQYWSPLLNAFPDLERHDDVFLAGVFKNGLWAASTGHFIGTFEHDWLNIPANRQATYIRFGEILSIENGKISKAYILLDIVGVARQAGVDLIPKGLGAELLTPGPMTRDGIRLLDDPDGESEQSLDLVRRMIAGLMRYDGLGLESMGQTEFWHPEMMWYGPSGIGVTRGLRGFQDYHQRPFLRFIPDRIGGNHVTQLASGDYVATGGWPSMHATTSGAPWVATLLPEGVSIEMRVMDFWRREGDRLKENWVLIDIPDVFRQCGIDVFEPLTSR